MNAGKLFKWGASALRVTAAKIRLGSRLQLPRGGKPVYLGRGVRLMVEEGGVLKLGEGCYIDDRSRIQVGSGATLDMGGFVYANTNCRIVANDRITIGAHTNIGPNACIFDHDHVFDADGIHRELRKAPIGIGQRCWLGANVVVTKGVTVADATLIGGGALLCAPSPRPASTWATLRASCAPLLAEAVA